MADQINDLCTDDSGNIYTTGHFSETAIFGSHSLISSGIRDIFVTKMDSNGNWLWVESAGGSYNDCGTSINTDTEDNIYVTGHFESSANFGSLSPDSDSRTRQIFRQECSQPLLSKLLQKRS